MIVASALDDTDSGLSFVQITMHNCANLFNALFHYIEDFNIPFALCQYPYIFENFLVSLPHGLLCFLSLSCTAEIICSSSGYVCVKSLCLSNSVFLH